MREGLKQAIMALARKLGSDIYPYVITACPDGEGSWFQQTVNLSPEAAKEAKDAYKAKFTPEFVRRITISVAVCSEPLVLVDIGGIPSPENYKICASATHAILLAGDLDRLPEWREFCNKLGLGIIAEIHSDYHGTEDVVPTLHEDNIWRGSVHHLERGEEVQERLTIQALADILLQMVTSA
jgi:CRISPR-associated protein Csx3